MKINTDNLEFKELADSEILQIEPLIVELAAYHNQLSASFEDFYQPLPVPETIEWITKKVCEHQAKVLVFTDKEKIIGFVQFSWSKNHGSIDRLFITEAYRNLGLGKQLMEQAMDDLRSKNLDFIDISVLTDNKQAQSFYKSLGFKKRTETLTLRL